MGGRHEARQWAVQFLFQRDFNMGDIESAIADFWQDRKFNDKARLFAEELIKGVETRKDEIDRLIRKYAEHWDLKRMGAVDRNIMRVAMYEMMYRPDIPPVVSINEAVEIAKDLSGVESGKFVNGILDHACKEQNRPARSVAPGRSAETKKEE